MEKIRVFLSFDLENDEDLHDLMLEQSARASSGFEISAGSEAGAMSTNAFRPLTLSPCPSNRARLTSNRARLTLSQPSAGR